MFGKSEYAWKTIPMSRLFGDTCVTSRPSTTTRPSSGRSKPATMRSAVVLPQPDGPSSERNSPSPSLISIPSSAFTVPKSRWRFWSSRNATIVLPRRGDDRAPCASLAADEEERQHRRPRYPEAEQRERAGREALRLVDELDEDGERLEGGEVRDRELAHDDREGQERPCERRGADVREDHLHERRRPARAEALRGLGQRMHVDGAEARVEREDHVGAREEAPRLRVEPVGRALEEAEEADDHDDRRHDERDQREERDHRPELRQLQMHPVDRRHEEEQRDHDRLEGEQERDLQRVPEVAVVDHPAVVRDRAALARLVALEAEEQRRDQRDEEVDRREQQPRERRRGDEPARLHLAHLAARRCNGM